MGAPIKEFYLNPTHFNKWAHQNEVSYTGVFIEGCLLDNFVVKTKHGMAAVYEHYVNPNISDYRVEFQRTGKLEEGTGFINLWHNWYLFEDRENELMEKFNLYE